MSADTKPRWSMQHVCVKAIVLISATMSAAYYVLALAMPMKDNLPIWAVVAVGAGIAALALALDILKPSMVALTAESWRERRWISAFFSAFMAFWLIVISAWAIDGLLLMMRGWALSGPAAISERVDLRRQQLIAINAEIILIGDTRPARAIEVDMSKVKIDASVLRRTNYCDPAQITKDESRIACEPLAKLKSEMQAALRKVELMSKAEAERKWLDANPRPASGDPQIAMTARVTGFSEDFVSLMRWTILGLVIELVLVIVPAVLAARKPKPRFAAEDIPVIGVGLSGPNEASAKARLASLFDENGGRIKTTSAQLASLVGASGATCVKWRRAWKADGLIKERWDGSYLVIEPGAKWYVDPGAVKLLA
jgi:hypothetical protein